MRQYAEASIAGDYAKLINLGALDQTPEELKDWSNKLGIKLLRVTLGKPEAYPEGGPRYYLVPYVWEFEKDGKEIREKEIKAGVRPTTADPHKWIVRGGI